MRQFFLFALFLLAITASSKTKDKPNVLFIISDDLTATALSSYENKACFTPNIDKLASEKTIDEIEELRE